MSTLRRFAHKDATVPANTSWYLPDLGEFRGKQERYTRQNTAMTERPACSTSDRFAETSRLNAARKNSGLTPIFLRGYFLETWNRDRYFAAGLHNVAFVQGNIEELLG